MIMQNLHLSLDLFQPFTEINIKYRLENKYNILIYILYNFMKDKPN